jgi:hypothetical protein
MVQNLQVYQWKSQQRCIYFPNLKKADYFLKIENTESTMNALKIKRFNKIESISTVYSVDTNKIKSKQFNFFNTHDYKQKTKIVATLGPACSTREIIKRHDAGVNVFRINFSHADYSDVEERIK